LGSQSVLVVEDSPLNARLIEALLSPTGLHVILAGDAESALEALEESVPDLILMDMQLPGMSGLDLTRLLKANLSRCKIPIIALTANNSFVERQTIISAGCDSFICKPIDSALFAAQILLFVAGVELSATGSELNQAENVCPALKEKFLLEGAQESRVLLEAVERGAKDLVLIDRVLHRWIGCGDAAGIPEISVGAERLRALIACKEPDLSASIEVAQALKKLFLDQAAGCGSRLPTAAQSGT
jgi:two-component system, cell cycle response regulator DivK